MTAERCNLCGAALTAPESIDLGTCFPSCDDLEFDRLVEILAAELEAALKRYGAEDLPAGLIPCGPIEISGAYVDELEACADLPCPVGPPTGLMPDDAEPELWQCVNCAAVFDRPDARHGTSIPEHAPDCTGDRCSTSCPVEDRKSVV